jgi:hypothetical protein
VPPGGFGQLRGMDGSMGFNVGRQYHADNALPMASTCFNLLKLPNYTSYEWCRRMVCTGKTQMGALRIAAGTSLCAQAYSRLD